jgi:hypothetical protein
VITNLRELFSDTMIGDITTVEYASTPVSLVGDSDNVLIARKLN